MQDSFDAGGPVIPYITVIRSSLKQIGLLDKGHTDLLSAAKSVGLDAAGVSLGGWAGAHAGAAAGSVLGPYGIVVGGIIGALAGSTTGRAITNEIKYAEFKASADAYEKSVINAQNSIQARQSNAHNLLAVEVARQQVELQRYENALQQQLKDKLIGWDRWQQSRCIGFVKVFPKVLDRLEAGLRGHQQSELGGIQRSQLVRRVLWPSLEDVKYRLVRSLFQERTRVIAAAKEEFVALASKTPSQVAASDAIRQIEDFVRGNPFESRDFDKVCRQLREATETAHQHESRLREQAAGMARSEYAKRLAAVRKRFQEVAREVSEFLSQQAETVTSAKEKLLYEARMTCSPKTGPSWMRVLSDHSVGRRLGDEEVSAGADS